MRALVLCAGFGTRLGPLCENLPKPLLEVGPAALVEHALLHLGRHGIRDVFVNVHFRAEQVVARLGNGSRYGVRVHYLYESALLGTAGSARAVHALATRDDLLVHYGDVLSEHDLAALGERHRRCGGDATIVVHERRGSNSRVVLGPEDRVQGFFERPPEQPANLAADHWAFSGICVLSPSCLAAISDRAGVDLPRDVFPTLAMRGALFAHRHVGYRCAIDSPARLAAAREAWSAGTMFASRGAEAT